MKRCILEGASNPTLLLGIDSSPWNKASTENGRHAQEALDLATKAAIVLWPSFERVLAQVAPQLGVRRAGNPRRRRHAPGRVA